MKPSAQEKEALYKALRGTRVSVMKKVAIGPEFGFRIGRPHTADELVAVSVPTGKTRVNRVETRHARRPGEVLAVAETQIPEVTRTVFIRGKVKHVEHKSVEFRDWVKVFRNTEIRLGPDNTSNGIRWID